ncbi:MAG: protein kinase [Anaerolineae bacterium]|nr:protein kinase [Anaerolineae bacterium]
MMQHGLPTLPLGHALQGRYQIVKKLGSGGYGSVYLAEDLRLRGRQVAVKELSDPSESAQQLFKQEAQVLAALDHPGLVRVSDFFGEGRSYYLVMDYIAGRDLLDLVIDAEKQRRHFPIDKAIDWMIQVCDAVGYLHQQQPPIIHRDIKPNNVRLTQKDRAVLVDFGIAKIDPKAKTQVMAKAVSQGFSPPEQYGLGGGTDTRSDVYALGATLYCVLTLTPPADSFERLMRGAALTPPSQLNSKVNSVLEKVVLQAMSVNVAQRFRDAGEMLAALQTVAGRPVTRRSSVAVIRRPLIAPIASQHTPPPPSRSESSKPPTAVTPQRSSTVGGSSSPGVTCPQCGALVRLGARFCPQCGKTMDTSHRCPNCATPYRSGARFCAKCGASLPITGPPDSELQASSVPAAPVSAPIAVEEVAVTPPAPPDFAAEGLQHFQAGRFKEAVAAFESALQVEAQSVEIYVALGKAHTQSQDLDAALAALEKGLEKYPQSPELHVALGKTALTMKRPAAALEHLEQALGLQPGDVDLATLAADTAFSLGRYSDAAANFEHLLRTRSQDPIFRGRLAVCYLLGGKLSEAEPLVQDLLQQESLPTAELEFLKGVLNYKKGSQRWAMRNFHDTLRLDSRHALAEFFVGELYADWGRWREALEAYERSIALNPGLPAAHLGLSTCWQALGDSAKAETSRQRALALDPGLDADT